MFTFFSSRNNYWQLIDDVAATSTAVDSVILPFKLLSTSLLLHRVDFNSIFTIANNISLPFSAYVSPLPESLITDFISAVYLASAHTHTLLCHLPWGSLSKMKSNDAEQIRRKHYRETNLFMITQKWRLCICIPILIPIPSGWSH